MKQKIITIGLIQTKVAQDRQANLEKTVKMIAWAAKKGAQIVCLQELFQTIYFPQYKKADKDKYAEAVPGAVTNALSVLAKELGVVIIAPVFEKKNGRYYNCAAVINEKGKLLPTYHKIHILPPVGAYLLRPVVPRSRPHGRPCRGGDYFLSHGHRRHRRP